MPWRTLKTDWKAQRDATGAFIGDYVNIEDYNRIKNNLIYLRDLVEDFFGNLETFTVGADKTSHAEYYYADEWNLIEDGLQKIQDRINLWDFGEKQTFFDNGQFIAYAELNRIESAELKLYEVINNSAVNRQRLAFRLGTRSSTIKP